MAYQKSRSSKKEHAFKRIARDVKAGEIPPVVLLCGKEQYLAAWGAELIENRFVNPAAKAFCGRYSDGNRHYRGVRNPEYVFRTKSYRSF